MKNKNPLFTTILAGLIIAFGSLGCISSEKATESVTLSPTPGSESMATLDPSIDPKTATVSALLTRAAVTQPGTRTPVGGVASPSNTPLPLPTNTPRPSPTQPSVPGLSVEWSIQTGDLTYFGVAGDGTIYGLAKSLYAEISPDGQVLSTYEVDLGSCLRPNFSGGAGASDINGASKWFLIQPDGFISSYAGIGSHGPCTITPGTPPNVEELENSFVFTPLSTDGLPRTWPATPEGFKSRVSSIGQVFAQDDRRSDFDFYIKLESNQAGFIDRDFNFSVIDLPENLDLEKNIQKNSIFVKITPWDDVYIQYSVYDAIGNANSDSIILIKSDGSRQSINEIPQKLNDRYLIAYDRINVEQYYKYGRQLDRVNSDYKVITTYTLPEELERPLQGTSMWVGHDHAFYVFDGHYRTLTKYRFTNEP